MGAVTGLGVMQLREHQDFRDCERLLACLPPSVVRTDLLTLAGRKT